MMKKINAIAGGIHAIIANRSLTTAADHPVALPTRTLSVFVPYEWNGPYIGDIGGHAGDESGRFVPDSNPQPLQIGDGRPDRRTERIPENYYAFAINRTFTFTADYQLVTNPAYNADRGPASIFSGVYTASFEWP